MAGPPTPHSDSLDTLVTKRGPVWGEPGKLLGVAGILGKLTHSMQWAVKWENLFSQETVWLDLAALGCRGLFLGLTLGCWDGAECLSDTDRQLRVSSAPVCS